MEHTPGETPQPLGQQLLTTAGMVAALALVLGLRLVLPQLSAPGRGRVLFALGLLLLAGMALGQVASLLRLPRLTGYLTAGILAGPHGLAMFGATEVHKLELINALALALIALQAGAEFTLDMLRRGMRSLLYASFTQLAILAPGLVLTFVLLKGQLPFLHGLSLSAVVAVAVVWAAIGVSKSPAATLAVLGETRAKGPLTSYAMAMVVVFDVVVLLLFAVAMMVARATLEPGGQLSLDDLSRLGMELVASVAAGTTLGLLVAAWLWVVKSHRLLFIVVLAYGITAFCRYFHYDTLLVFVIAGFVVQNFSRQGPALVEAAGSAATAVMVVFFATAGAHLDLAALANAWQAALALVLIRVLLTWGACRVGHRLARDPPAVTRYGFTSLVSQAGVTIGLVTVAAQNLPGAVGPGVAALGIAVVGINEMVGPVLFKLGLARAGELPGSQPVASIEEPPAPVEAARSAAHP